MREILTLFALLIVGIISLRKPFFGVLAILVTAVLRDTMNVETYGAFLQYHGYMVLYIATMFGLLLVRPDLTGELFPRSATDWGMVGFLLVLIVSATVNGVAVLGHKYIDLFFKAVVMYLLLSRLADTPKRLVVVAVAMILAGTYLTYLAWSKYRSGELQYARPYLISSFHDFGLLLSITLPMIGALLAKRMRLPFRLFLLGLIPLYVLVGLRTHSRSAYLGIGIGLAMLVWYHRRRVQYLVLAAPLVVYAIAHNPDVVMKRLESIWTHKTVEGTEDISIQMRLEQMRTAARTIKSNPLFGVGPRQFFMQYEELASPEDYKGWSYTMHMVPLLILCEEGLLGAFFFYGLLALGSLRDAWFVVRRSRGDPEMQTTGIVAAGGLMGFIAFLAYGLGQPQMWIANIYGTVALVTATRRVTDAHLATQAAYQAAPQDAAATALPGTPTTQIVFT